MSKVEQVIARLLAYGACLVVLIWFGWGMADRAFLLRAQAIQIAHTLQSQLAACEAKKGDVR